MKLISKWPRFFTELSVVFSTIIRLTLNALLVIVSLALCVGVIKSGIDLYHSLRQPLETVLQNMLLDVVFIVALVEIAITIISYLRDGQVHVRYIIDTILIIMLNEVVSAWFHNADFPKMASLALIIATLGALRVVALRVGQDKKES